MQAVEAMTETDAGNGVALRRASFQPDNSAELERILRADPRLSAYMDNAERYRIQVIFSQVDRDRGPSPRVTTWAFRQDASFYYPASLVKLPVAILALERLDALGLSKSDRFEIHPANACSRYDADACDSVRQCIEQIFVYSNNTAYNRLFEFLGRDQINDRLRALGYQGTIQRRFRPGCGGELGLATGALTFYDSAGNVRYRQSARLGRRAYPPLRDDMRAGRKTRTAIGLIDEPMDFSDKNYVPLAEFHRMLVALVYPSAVPPPQRFALKESDRAFLLETMALRPRDLGGPQPDSFRKYLLVGGLARMPETIEIVNKVGLSYGFVSDVAYIRDTSAGVDFFLSATIYANDNEIVNDADYEYDTLAYPFMRALGQALHRHALARAESTHGRGQPSQ